MLRRSKKTTDVKKQYIFVVGFFVVVCVVAVLYTIFNPKPKLSQMPVLDDSQIMVHNGQGHQFKQSRNSFFDGKTLNEAKTLFMSALSDTNQIPPCKSSTGIDETMEEEIIDVPDAYDWREAYPHCVQPVMNTGAATNCSAGYAFTTLSVVEDRICMQTNQTVKLSAQEILDCDPNSFGC